jgi:3-hydroxyisobutyrate dehydrogenase-like beta-hydroxyacid dehydrogenase
MRVGWIGLGIMGSRMAANLARAGHELVVHNRTTSVAEAWVGEHGGDVALTPRDIRADIVFTMLVDGPQVEQALLGPAGAAIDAAPQTLFVDMSTIGPAASRALGERIEAFVEAPVTGSSPKAEDATLTIIVGGADVHVSRAWPLLEVLGSTILHAGPVGDAQTIKIVNNAVASANAATLAQALLVGAGAGVDLDALVSVMAAGSGGSTMLELKAAAMREHDWTTLFKLEHMLKDVELCLDSSVRAGVPFPAAEAARDALAAGLAAGLGEADFAALLTVYEDAAQRRL